MSIDSIPEASDVKPIKTKPVSELNQTSEDLNVVDKAVRPSRPIQSETIKLSLLDAYAPKVWVPQTHFWPQQGSIEQAYHVLKTGLSRTISEVPALVGRLKRISNDPRDVIIAIDSCASVELAYEDLSNHASVPGYDKIKAAAFPIADLIAPLCAKAASGTVYEGAPIAAFKLNKLKGGMALSCAFNHLFADATTVAEIQKLWALHSADVSNGVAERVHRREVDDAACRGRLDTPVPGANEEFSLPHYKLFPATSSSLALPAKQQQTEVAMKMIGAAKSQISSVEVPKWCFWRFTPENLAKLKADCSAGLSNGEWVSTINALIGLFWSRVLLSKQDPQCAQITSTLLFPVNIRTRLNLDPLYFGNAVDIIAAEASIVDLAVNSSSGGTVAARSIRKAIDGWSAESWNSWQAAAKKLPGDKALCPNPLVLLSEHNMIFNDYTRSEMCVLDWGKGVGRPDATRYMRPASMMKGCATAVIVYPRLADGSLEVVMSATDGLRDALLKDEVFCQYTKLIACFT